MAKETVSWTDAKGVTHTRKVKKSNKLLHLFAFAATGGVSGVVTAAKAASDAAYNSQTRQRIDRDRQASPPVKSSKGALKSWQAAKTKAAAGGRAACILCDKPDCDGTRHLPR